MKSYPDTSFLFSLYVQQAHSTKAAAHMKGAKTALPLTSLGRFELFNAIRLAVFRKALGVREAHADMAAIEMDIAGGVLAVTPCDWAAVHAAAERLSAEHTLASGYRGMDVLHVATALTLGATEFLTFDASQAVLARAEGVNVKP